MALITGGASGIGAAFARVLAGRGVFVVLADRQVEVAEAVADGIRRNGGRASTAELDVRDATQFEQVAQEVQRQGGSIDYACRRSD